MTTIVKRIRWNIDLAREIIEKEGYTLLSNVYKNLDIKLNLICPIGHNWEISLKGFKNGHRCGKCFGRNRTNDEFKEQASKIHENKYDYSLVEYKIAQEKIIIICPKHGQFEQVACSHLRGTGCFKCGIDTTSNAKKKTTEEFIEEAQKIHGNRYDYSLVDYIDGSTKVKIICSEHGEFKQIPNDHLQDKGCSKCGGTRKKTREEFIEESNKIHNNYYDYSLVNYINGKTKVIIICKKHGQFEQKASSHLSGHGCAKCGRKRASNKQRKTQEQFIYQSKEIHNNYYDYSLVNYVNDRTKVKIICPEHGEFEQTPSGHLDGNRCPKCAINNKKPKIQYTIDLVREIVEDKGYILSSTEYNSNTKLDMICPKKHQCSIKLNKFLVGRRCGYCAGKNKTTSDFIQQANKVHNNKYDYSLVEYIDTNTKVKIICPDHGEFDQGAGSHLSGRGCPKCGVITRSDDRKKTKEQFIEESIEIHGDIYDYS